MRHVRVSKRANLNSHVMRVERICHLRISRHTIETTCIRGRRMRLM